MKIYLMHPSYLDSKRLVETWRSSVLIKNVLIGKGGKNLFYNKYVCLFSRSHYPINFIIRYMIDVKAEADKRDFKFDSGLILSWSAKENRRWHVSMEEEQPNVKLEIKWPQLQQEARKLLLRYFGKRHNYYHKLNEDFVKKDVKANNAFKVLLHETVF